MIIRIETNIAAPIERCFDLARSIDAHLHSTQQTDERVISPRQSGLMELGEEVTWQARHFFVTQQLTSKITAFDRPRYFQDTMQRGIFKSFQHDHFFESHDGAVTTMIDVLRFAAPLGILGWFAERIVLTRYLRNFLMGRARSLKALAETSDGWKPFVSEHD